MIFIAYLFLTSSLEFQGAALLVQGQVTSLTWLPDPFSPCVPQLLGLVLTNILEGILILFSHYACDLFSSSVTCFYGEFEVTNITIRCRYKCSNKIYVSLRTDTLGHGNLLCLLQDVLWNIQWDPSSFA